MAFIVTNESRNIWDEVCKEVAAEDPTVEPVAFAEEPVKRIEYSSGSHHPAVYGSTLKHDTADGNALKDFNPGRFHPALAGLVAVCQDEPSVVVPKKDLPDPKACSPRQYLEEYVFPVLLPGLLELLKSAGKQQCFERRFFKFNGCDFLTEYLYNNNPLHKNTRGYTPLDEIDFVRDMNETHPRKPLPWSLLWTPEEAALKIQSFFRGFQVRKLPHIQELRQYQRTMREDNEDILNKISDFWTRQEARSESRASAKSRQSSENAK